MSKLILIEGLPGSGKSSLATHLHKVLSASRLNVELILEASELNPFRFQSGTDPKTEVAEFLNAIPAKWKSFADQNIETHTTFVQEGMTFQQQVNFLVWQNQRSAILPLVDKIQSCLRQFEVQFIYLAVKDPVAALQHTMNIRGHRWVDEKLRPAELSPFAQARNIVFPEAAEAMIREIQQVTEEIFRQFPFSKKRIDATNRDWRRVEDESVAFVVGN